MAKSTKVQGGKEVMKIYSEFFGGIQRDDKSTVKGGMLNVEELDILENANFVRPTQILSSDTLPANTNFFSYCEDPLVGTGYAVGADNNGNTYAHIFQNTNIATSSPGGWSDVGGSSLVANAVSPSTVHYVTTSGSSVLTIYFITGNNVLTKWTSSGGIATTGYIFSSLTASMGNISVREINGSSYWCAGNYVSTIDKNGVFTEQAFQLPTGYISIDICYSGGYFFVLSEQMNTVSNKSCIFIWDGVSTQFTDQIPIPMGSPQWIYNFKSTITACCCSGGLMKLFYLNSPSVGAICKAYPYMQLNNVQLENQTIFLGNGGHGSTWTVPISPAKSVFVKNDILYFALWKTDKTAIYALGQLNDNSPFALWLAKRFDASHNYSNIIPYAAHSFGNKIFSAYQYGLTTQGNNITLQSFCDPLTAARSSNAVMQSVWDDDGEPMNNKELIRTYVESYPLPSGCSLDAYVASDYGSFTEIKQSSGIIHNILSSIFAIFRPTGTTNKKLFSWKILFTSNGLTAPQLTAVGMRKIIKDLDA